MNQTKLIGRLKNNERAFCFLLKEEQEFLEEHLVDVVVGAPKFMVNKIHYFFHENAIYRLRPDFELPYGGLLIPKGCDLLDPVRCRVEEPLCAIHSKFGNPKPLERCQTIVCEKCIASRYNRPHLKQLIADQGGQRAKEVPWKTELEKLQWEMCELQAAIHYPECWDTMVYPTFLSALMEIGCTAEHEGDKPKQDRFEGLAEDIVDIFKQYRLDDLGA